MTYAQVLQFLANAIHYCHAESKRGNKQRAFDVIDAARILNARYADIQLEHLDHRP